MAWLLPKQVFDVCYYDHFSRNTVLSMNYPTVEAADDACPELMKDENFQVVSTLIPTTTAVPKFYRKWRCVGLMAKYTVARNVGVYDNAAPSPNR